MSILTRRNFLGTMAAAAGGFTALQKIVGADRSWSDPGPANPARKMLFDSLLGTPAVAPFIAAKRDKIESGNYETEFPLRWMQKDMHLAAVSAYETGVDAANQRGQRNLPTGNARWP